MCQTNIDTQGETRTTIHCIKLSTEWYRYQLASYHGTFNHGRVDQIWCVYNEFILCASVWSKAVNFVQTWSWVISVIIMHCLYWCMMWHRFVSTFVLSVQQSPWYSSLLIYSEKRAQYLTYCSMTCVTYSQRKLMRTQIINRGGSHSCTLMNKWDLCLVHHFDGYERQF